VLAVFKVIGVRPDIFSIIFGESVLNDAVAIVLARTILSFNQPNADVGLAAFLQAVLVFCSIFIGSMLIGVLGGVLSSLSFKHLHLRRYHERQVLEAALTFAFPWASYYMAEALALSGIVAILFCGIIMASYARENFSSAGVELTRDAFECIAMVAEAFVFIYLGMAVFTFPLFEHTVWRFALVSLAACFVGRLHVFVATFFINIVRARKQIFRMILLRTWRLCTRKGAHVVAGRRMPSLSYRQALLIWFSGLRGGVAFAIAAASYGDLDFPANCGGLAEMNETRSRPVDCASERSDGLAILQATLLIAIFTIFFFGAFVRDVALACDVLTVQQPLRSDEGTRPPPVTRTRWRRFDARYVRPRLTSIKSNEIEHVEPRDSVYVAPRRSGATRRKNSGDGQSGLLAHPSVARGWDTELLPPATEVPQHIASPRDSNGACSTPDEPIYSM